MKKIVKISLISLSSLIALVLLTFGAIAYYLYNNQEEIKKICVDEINKYLAVKVSVDEINLGVSAFYASVICKNVNIPTPKSNDYFVKAKSLSFKFSIIDVLRKKYVVKKISLTEVDANIEIYEDHTDNFTIWKTSNDTSNNFLLSLNGIEISKSRLRFTHYGTKQKYQCYIHKLKSSAKINNNASIFDIDAKLLVESLSIDKTIYITKKETDLSTNLTISYNDKTSVELEDGTCKIDKIKLMFNALVAVDDEYLSVNVKSDNADIKELSKLSAITEQNIVEYDGKLDIDMIIKGFFSQNKMPGIHADYHIKNATLLYLKDNEKFDNIDVAGIFTCKNIDSIHNSLITIKNLSATYKNSTIVATAKIKNPLKPTVALKAKYDITLDDIPLKINNIDTISGRITGNINYKKSFKTFDSLNILDGRFVGKIKSSNINIKIKDIEKIILKDIDADFNEREILLQNTSINFADIFLKATLQTSYKDFFLSNKTPFIKGNIALNTININRLFNNNKPTDNKNQSFAIPFNFDIKMQADTVYYDDMQFADISGNVVKHDNEYEASHLSGKMFSGDVFLKKVSLTYSPNALSPFIFEGILAHIDSRQLFTAMKNFQQDVITDKNIYGYIYADMVGSGYYSSDSGISMKQLNLDIDAQINEGRLTNVELLKKLSLFIKEDVLMNVVFDRLQNNLHIVNNKIIIPEMQINSNAMNITLAGEHEFDGKIDYKIKILLSELLSRKRRERNIETQEAVNNNKKRTTLFVTITGTTDAPIFHYDIKNVINALGTDDVKKAYNNQKKELDIILKKEFKLLEQNQKDKSLIKQREAGNFVIDFDEEEPVKQEIKPITKDTTTFVIEWEDE